ncbi:MAG: Xaa-Pro peptidase family protein [Methanocella sp.]
MSDRSVFARRREQAQRLMREQGVSAMQVTSRENYFYLTGDPRNVARMFLPQSGDPVVIVFAEEVDEARERTGIEDVRGWRTPAELMGHFFSMAKAHEAADKKIGFCVHANPGFLVYKFIRSNPKATIVANEDITMPMRYVKDPDELAAMRKAAATADKGMAAARDAIRPGATEIEVAAEAEYVMRKAGTMRYGASTFVDAGPNSSHLHGGTTDRKIAKGDLVVVDLHPVVDMYSADLARTFVCGGASPEQAKLIELYSSVQSMVAGEVRPGWKVGAIAERMGALFAEKGHPEWIRGPTHGVGLEFEEWPHPSHFPAHLNLVMQSGWTLAMGHSILPVKGVGGVKIEDTVLVTEKGGESLNRFPHYGP